jgi:hypothetical protein
MLPGPQLRELLKWPRPLPLEEERVRLLHEVNYNMLIKKFELIIITFILSFVYFSPFLKVRLF